MYNKLFTKILDSTIWLAPDAQRLVWITLIAAMDEDSIARFAAPENLAARARVTVAACKAAIKAFESPDPYGLHQENEGRRIERIPDGWLILNGQKYREIVTKIVQRERTKIRTREWREREAVKDCDASLSHVTPSDRRDACDDSVTPSEAVSEAAAISEKKTPPAVAGTPPRAARSGLATRLPPDFELTPERRAIAEREKADPDREFLNFTDHWKAASGEKARKHDWDATWRIWCRRVPDFQRGGAKQPRRESLTTEQLEAREMARAGK